MAFCGTSEAQGSHIMKWCPFDPAAFLEGVIGLDAEERGFYITVIALCYARAPRTDVRDELVIGAMACRPQVWRRVKKSLILKEKVHETDGKLTANRVQTTLQTAAILISNQSRRGRLSAAKRRENKQLVSTGLLVKTKTKTKAKDIRKKKEDSPLPPLRGEASRLPADWQLTDQLHQFAIDHNQNPADARDEFVDYWIGVAGQRAKKVDWAATFRNRIRDLARKPKSNGNRPTYKDKRQEELEYVKQRIKQAAYGNQQRETAEPAGPNDWELSVLKPP